MAFDPCREWLGIDPVDLADPCSVLGLPAGDHPAAVIAEAAAARLKQLGEIAPGPFGKAHETLVRRVEEARDRLLETAIPTPEPITTEPVGGAPMEARPAEPWNSTGPPMTAAKPAYPEAELDPLSRISTVRPRRRRQPSRSSGSTAVLMSVTALLAAAVAVLVVVVVKNPFQQPDRAGAKVALRTDPAPSVRPQPLKASETGRKPEPEQPPAANRPRKPKARPSPPPPDSPAGPPASSLANDEPAREPPAISQPPAEDKARREREMQAAETVNAERRRAIDTLLTEAFASLQKEQFDAANGSIKKAYETAGDDVEAATRAEAWRALATYARDFIGHREQAFSAAAAGREYQAGGKVFAIIEITPTLVTYKFEGRIMRVPRDQLDPALAMAIVEKWFAADGRAANHLFLGAHWLCLDPPQPKRARAEWQIAGDGGEDVDLLLALCDDPVIQQAGKR